MSEKLKEIVFPSEKDVHLIENYKNAQKRLQETIIKRLRRNEIEDQDIHTKDNNLKLLRYPVAFFFIRGDRAGEGKRVAEEAMASLKYWDIDSGKYLDVLFPGWYKNRNHVFFDMNSFFEFRNAVEKISKWEYSGETDILLLNFDFDLENEVGCFKYDETITLLVEEMVRKGTSTSIDALIHELVKASKSIGHGSLWEISDKIGYQRFRKSLWNYIKSRFLDKLSKTYDELKPFAICNLEK